ncbi:MAG: protein-export chaperone SecB [Rickettsiales bacterium]|jgi:preprotein translocase subunit SecB|nr:protein-export chaperone SecB [Rickettsiales bacterium]
MAQFKLMSSFLKKLSFDSPSVPELFFKQDNTQAKMDINLDIQIKSSENKLFMVDLVTKLHSKLDDPKAAKTVFEIDCVYSALVQIEKDDGEEDVKHSLLADVPTLLFPNVRALVLRMTAESGFPPFQMQVVDFEELYKSKK